MKTSSEIYSWILNSPEFKPSNFTISYLDAIKKKYIDVSLLKWKPIDRAVDPGDIPWTRVYFIKWKNQIVWDRENRICNLSIAIEEDQYLDQTFKILSFNVLSDVYDKHITNMDKRIPDILHFISGSGGDIICLQEVTDKLIEPLGKTGYLIHKTDTKTNNVAILSKIPPIKYVTFGLGNIEKQAILCVYAFENGQKLNVVGIHLTSNTNRNAKSTRTQQINRILQFLSVNGEPNSPVVIVGDTNEPDKIEQLYKFLDSNKSTVVTYDPSKNLLAKKLSETGGIYRYDRIYTFGLTCESFNVIENNTISDHYAVQGVYRIENIIYDQHVPRVAQTNKTALCVIPPWNIQKLLPKYNQNWMPHINVFWQYIPEHLFEKYADFIKRDLISCNIQPFVITLKNVNTLDHEKNSTIYYELDENVNAYIRQIRKIVSKLIGFPNEEKLIHLSLELCENTQTEKQKLIKKYNTLHIDSFKVNTLYMISCEESTEMLIKNMITFEKPNRNTFIQQVLNFLSQFNVNASLCGSDAFDLQSEDSDVDILCEGTDERNVFFEKIYKPILQCGLFCKCITVKNDYTYELKLYTDFTTVDIHYVNVNDQTEKYFRSSYSLYEDPRLVLKIIEEKYDIFKMSLKYVRNLLKSHKMYGQQYCYLSGISLAILTAYIVKTHDVNTIEEFCIALKTFDFDQIITLDKNKKTYQRQTKSDQFIVILQPSSPYANTVRNIIRSTKLLIVDCLQNGNSTLKLPSKLTFTVKNNYDDEMCSNTNMKDVINYSNQVFMRFMLQIERLNEKNILKPFDDWIITENIATFTIEHNCEQGEILFHLERTEKNLRELFRGYEFTVTKEHVIKI